MLENDLNPSTANNSETIFLKDYQPPKFLISEIELDANLGHERTVITAQLKVRRNGSHDEALVLNGEKLSLLSVALDESILGPEQYNCTDTSMQLTEVPDNFVLKIVTELQPHLNTELSGLYQSSGNFCTQCEAEGFRRITYFLDRPDVLSKYTVTIVADQQANPVLLSNGNLQDHGINDDGTHWAKWHDPHPKPSYLFALVAGDLNSISDQFVTVSGQSVELNIYTQPHNIDKCDHAMVSLKKSMLWDEQVYGREYDLSVYNIVAVDDFNMGAMENKGLNIFNSKYVLANQQTATDVDYEGIESVIGHEYFHNWSGNRVTCRDWFQLSLKEGFTVFRDQEFSADMNSRAVKRIRDVQVLRAHQFKEDAGPMAHAVRPESYQEINNFYTVTIYEKGAEVIRMMHSLVGKKGFRTGTDLYFERYDGQAVTTEDFVLCMEQANAIDLQQFRLWYTQAGTPQVSIEQQYSNGKLSLIVEQSCPPSPGQPHKKPFQIPISIALFSVAGEKLLETTLSITAVQQQFEFADLEERPIVSILRDFSAPIKLSFAQSAEDLATLIKVDDNGFARWESMQRLSLNLLLPAIDSGKLDPQAYQNLLDAMRGLIASKPKDKAIFAEMLSMPSSSYMTEFCSPIDPMCIQSARKLCVKQLAEDLRSEFYELYVSNNQGREFSLKSSAMAERSLKNQALAYLVATEQRPYYVLAAEQYRSANNMTDRIAAFTALLHSEYEERQSIIDDFYTQWQDNALVLDKWFAIQAQTPNAEVLDDVKKLLSHPGFSINNPNKVRSLIGAFTTNLSGFHNSNGSGYTFLAERIINLNSINPQVAARLTTAFNSWKSYAQPYKDKMHKQLKRIDETPNLAKDVKEIVSKALL